ncbi:MAG: class I SAM-dependent RNA methyltransferase [Spirochaetales bacterium]|nr:class I SAM-dependent RNA methyltransferase [Spirochaetales bacterium]
MEGILRFKGRDYGVPFTLPGDLVQFQARGRHFRVVKIEPQADRRFAAQPFCAHFGDCGGCRGQHFPYEEQLTLKTKPILEAMEREFDLSVEMLPTPLTRSYRNRMDFVVDRGQLGLRPAGDYSRIVSIEHCAIQSDEANLHLAAVQAALRSVPQAAFSRKNPREGIVKYVTLRSGDPATVILTIEAGRNADVFYRDFIELILQALPGVSLIETQSEHPREVSCVPGGRALCGGLTFQSSIPLIQLKDSLDFTVPYDAFFQPNSAAFGVLLEAMEPFLRVRLGHLREAHVLDLFCGVGTLSLYLARRLGQSCRRFTGYDFTGSAISLAKRNLGLHGQECEFLEKDLNRPTDLPGDCDFIVIDPPRAGAGPALLKYLQSMNCPLLYISCNPESQLSDLRVLKSHRPVRAWMVDSFPQTPHLEQAVYLEKV